MTEKDEKAAPQTTALVRLKDVETRQFLEPRVQMEYEALAQRLHLDLRLGHIIVMGGKPYLSHEGVKAMMHDPETGPGIKRVHYDWLVSEWDNQQFIVKCIIETKDDAVYEGEGDAIGVPPSEIKRMNDDIRKNAKKGDDIYAMLKGEVKAYPLKNVSAPLAMSFAARRMAMTRAFNRAARLALKTSFTTIEETILEEQSYEGTAVVMPTDAQRTKMEELLKSSKAELQDVVLRYLEEHGKPNTWSEDVAGQFIEDAIKKVDEHRMAEKEKKGLPAAKEEPPKEDRGSLASSDYRG